MLPTHNQLETSLSDGGLVLQGLLVFLTPRDPATIPIRVQHLVLQLTWVTLNTAMEITSIELDHGLCLGCKTINERLGDFSFTTMSAQLMMDMLTTLL